MFIASAELDVRDGAAPPSPSLPLTVRTVLVAILLDMALTLWQTQNRLVIS
jgi:hypothetical protein